MDQPVDISRLLTLRKVTRSVSACLSRELEVHLTTLSPLIQPRNVFGRHLAGAAKRTVKGEDEAFDMLQGIYVSLANSGRFSLPKELPSPLDISDTSPEITPAEHSYLARIDQEHKRIILVSPLRWVLAYSGFGPQRLRGLIASKKKLVGNELQQCVTHFLVLHVTLVKRPAVIRLLAAMRFPIVTGHCEEFGELPITHVECPVPTLRPSDEIIIQSTELSGNATFEEVLDMGGILTLQDPLKEQLLDLIREHGAELLEPDSA